MMKKVAKVKEKWKGKEWYPIVAPKEFNSLVIGETPSLDPKLLVGRVIETSLMDLTGESGKYYIKLFFKISEVDGNMAVTKFFGHECTRDYVARIVQVRTTRIDTNEIINFKDGKMRVKSIAICNRNVSIKVEKDVRAAVRKMINERLQGMTSEDFIKGMITGKVQAGIRQDLNKIYPVRFFEFRKTEIM